MIQDLRSIPIKDLPPEFLEKWGGVEHIHEIMILAFIHHSPLAITEYNRMMDDLKTYERDVP